MLNAGVRISRALRTDEGRELDRMVSKRRSVAGPRSPARDAVLMLFTLATLFGVTSSRPVSAGPSQSAAAATSALVAAAEKDDDKDDGKDDTKGDAKGDDDDDARTFQQPVRVGDLIGRDVIAPLESQDLLGHVTKLVQHDDDVTIVMSYGGHFGFGTHLVCVPADALALTGYALQAKDISTNELDKLPPCDGTGDAPLDANASIKMKLAKPAH
jgi:hypothetical protein